MSDSPTEPACSRTPLGEMKIPEPMMFPEGTAVQTLGVVSTQTTADHQMDLLNGWRLNPPQLLVFTHADGNHANKEGWGVF